MCILTAGKRIPSSGGIPLLARIILSFIFCSPTFIHPNGLDLWSSAINVLYVNVLL